MSHADTRVHCPEGEGTLWGYVWLVYPNLRANRCPTGSLKQPQYERGIPIQRAGREALCVHAGRGAGELVLLGSFY